MTAAESNELTPTQTVISIVTGMLAGMRAAETPRSDLRWWVLEMLEPAVLALPGEGDGVDQDIDALHESRRSIERLTEKAVAERRVRLIRRVDDYLESHRTTDSTRLLREVRDELVRVLDGGAA